MKILSGEIIKIRNHGEKIYPEECCGALIASNEKLDVILEARQMQNINSGSSKTRYNIDPLELLELEDEMDEKNFTMVGIYHSHPDHPAKPSKFDLENAWPNLSYIVLSVIKGQARNLTAWRLGSNNIKFHEESIKEIKVLT